MSLLQTAQTQPQSHGDTEKINQKYSVTWYLRGSISSEAIECSSRRPGAWSKKENLRFQRALRQRPNFSKGNHVT